MEFVDAALMAREFLMMALMLVAPVVIVSLVVGLIISIGQTVTSIQEQTLSFAPRIVAVVVLMIFTMNWYLQSFTTYTNNLFAIMVELATK
ncbi:MAG: flagellar biosynthetic protein FliQ [Planctomycetota bacterium]